MLRFSTSLLLAACTTFAIGASAQTSPPQQAEPPASTTSPTAPPERAEHPAPPSAPGTPAEQAQHPGDIVGTVESLTSETMLVRSDDNRFHLFVFETGLTQPKGLKTGAHVRVISESTDDPGVRLAIQILPLEPGAEPEVASPPKEVLATQREIEKLARRWQVGVRVGAGLDPELFLFGVHTAIGPIFSKDLSFRPNAEFAFGELTDMIAINLEAAYRLPITPRQGRWSTYVGAGPGLNFIHQGVEKRDISFSNFNYETGLNVFTGVRFRRGTFAEIKGSLWAPGVPTLRLMFGYTF